MNIFKLSTQTIKLSTIKKIKLTLTLTPITFDGAFLQVGTVRIRFLSPRKIKKCGRYTQTFGGVFQRIPENSIKEPCRFCRFKDFENSIKETRRI